MEYSAPCSSYNHDAKNFGTSRQSCSERQVRRSLYQSLTLRQIRPFKVLQYPYSGEWRTDGADSSSCVLINENCGVPAPPLTLSFTKKRANGQLLAVADEEGYVNIFHTNRPLPIGHMCNDFVRMGIVQSSNWLAHGNAIFDVAWIKEDTHMLTASGDTTIKLWDVEKTKELGVMRGHSGSVKSITAHPCESDVFVSGSRDGCVAFWDIRTPAAAHPGLGEVSYEPVATIKDAHKGFTPKFRRRLGYTRSVTAVLYLKDERVIATAGANDGVIKYWDTRKLKNPMSQTLPEGHCQDVSPTGKNGTRLHGIAGLSLDPSGTRLIATSVDSKIYLYDVIRPEKSALKIFSGHVMGTFYIKATFSPDGSHILSGSSDHNVYIWKVDAVGNDPTVLCGHYQEVTGVTWCPTDFCKIATCSDDFTVRVWSMKDPRFALRMCPPRSTSAFTVEPQEPVSPCAPSQSNILQEDDWDLAGVSTFKHTNGMDTTPISKMDENNDEVTPPSKRSRALQFSSIGETFHAVIDQQDNPKVQVERSPSSVLSPPGSISRKRKTIVDYYGLQPGVAGASVVHDHGGE